MSDSANKLPVMTDEQRRENLEKATAVRKERKAFLVFDRFYFMGRVSRFPDTPFV